MVKQERLSLDLESCPWWETMCVSLPEGGFYFQCHKKPGSQSIRNKFGGWGEN